MFKHLSNKFRQLIQTEADVEAIFKELEKKYPHKRDPWGLNLKSAKKTVRTILPLYENYFQTRLFGESNIENKPYMVVSNHTGQIAIDGMLISTAFACKVKPPRILRPMVERFFISLPFINLVASEGGSVLGDRQNCLNLLERGESILAFPEGVRGIAKSTDNFYQLQSFGKGFFRLALEAGVEVLPVCTIGCEEFFPYVHQAKGLAKLFNLPALPLSLNYIPLPSPVDIYIGEPYKLPKDLNSNATDADIAFHVGRIEQVIKKMLQEGLKNRREFWAAQK